MLKKALVISISVMLSASFGTSALAATSSADVDKVMASIEKTNTDIEAKIAKAVIEADALEAAYLADIQKLEEGDTVVKLKEQAGKLESDLSKTNDSVKIEKIQKELAALNGKLEAETAKISAKMASLKEELDALSLLAPEEGKEKKKLDEKMAKLKERLDKKAEKYNDRTEKFTRDLDKLITDLYDTTLKMSNDMIQKAAEKGIQAEASWTLVELGGRLVWIDPIKVCH
ncbi:MULTISPECIES: hypothetical protein [Bacillaceae]|uniref:Chromosome partition protein Smc n=2 Tax=Metabacillus TaxID=2675233 RepID=A0ABS5LA74_9BACI|nr:MULTISPECIES: hypothetical protein [Bacillaceae]KZZ84111.1 hypothetical protein AS29_013025 [Bacillus sp. SJS]MBS2967631.1 hypothetical protein [Metabacillus flavus]